MQDEMIRQYDHTWKVFKRLVKDFEPDAWIHTGRNAMTPARLSYHILGSTRFYIEDESSLQFKSGKPFKGDWVDCSEEDLPTQADILDAIDTIAMDTERWLNELDFGAPNETFPWAGKAQLSVTVFLIRHSLYHLGELSALLNESKHGDVEDHYVLANQED